MGILDLFQSGPYMSNPRRIKNARPDLLRSATYQIVPSEHGIHMVQLDLDFFRPSSMIPFQRTYPSSVHNPAMTMAVLMDKSGSMSTTYAEGHAYNCCLSVLNHINTSGGGYDLVFYSDEISPAGNINNAQDLARAIRQNRPNGGTIVTGALKEAIRRAPQGSGVYVLVVTDGVFQDKVEVQEYITRTILPQLTLQDPYAYRLHFVGAGEGADEVFLHQLESVCSGQGFQLVTSHHHAHLSHSHEGMLDEIDRAFLGVGTDFEIGEAGHFDDKGKVEYSVIRVGNVITREWRDGPVGHFNFLPRHMVIGLEYKPLHSTVLKIELRYRDSIEPKKQQYIRFEIPLPNEDPAASISNRLIWPILRGIQGVKVDEALELEKEKIHLAELERQSIDLESLSRGGIPVSAQKRLEELNLDNQSDHPLFTSNLSPSELALLRRRGYRALGLVTGSAVYHVGAAFATLQDCEVTQLTQAYDHATDLAVGRLAEELRVIGAHGVIGVRLQVVRHEWGEKTIEVQAIGTAIQGPGKAPEKPWLSDLSGQEWWALERAGYEPVGLVWGHCSWFIITTQADQIIWQSWTNAEFTHWSDALSQARHRAQEHVLRRTREAGGTGVTGVRIERRLSEVELARPAGSWDPVFSYKHHNLLISIVGTTIRPRPGAKTTVRGTVNVLSLRDGRLRPAVLKQEADFKMSD